MESTLITCPVRVETVPKYNTSLTLLMWVNGFSEYFQMERFEPKIINYKILKLAEIDRHEEFVAADFYI